MNRHKRQIKIIGVTALLFCLMPLWMMGNRAMGGGSDVSSTKHNLTASGPGSVKVGGGGEACRFCHTPHAANPIAPLWNRDDPGIYYQTYESSTLVAQVPQPTGSSRLCLSCHDGTIALAQTYNSLNAPGSYTIYLSPGDRGYLGTDLRDDHPISFIYDAGLAMTKKTLANPAALPAQLPLDHENRLQCTTCHDPHDDSLGQFLRISNQESMLCISCHQYDQWLTSAHAQSPATLNSAIVDQWDNLRATTVREAGCESCHRPHSAGGRARLLRHEAEEANCFNCHDGSVAQTNMVAFIHKLSTHPVDNTTGVHDPTESAASLAKHVECVDCHNPHSTTSAGGVGAPFIKPSMQGASGVSSTGLDIPEARYEYEVCYKCHSTQNFAQPVVDRELGTNNIADEFSPTNASFHPIETQGVNPNVPSLTQQAQQITIMYCTDCHASNDINGPKGPHGSQYRPILIDNYTTFDNTSESPQAYALCYRCHDRTSILNDESFDLHKKHIEGEDTTCAACHDPHGVENNTHLINFDRDMVFPLQKTGQGPIFTDLGTFRGSCTLTCHGKKHDDKQYPD